MVGQGESIGVFKMAKVAVAKKVYVLDTNILLSDPTSLFSFKNNDIILPFTVLEELDKKKTQPNEVGANAREVARKLSELISKPNVNVKAGVELDTGGVLKMLSPVDFKKTFPKDWEWEKNDNQILSICYGLTLAAKKTKKPGPILITKDVLLKIKANFLNIACEDYKKISIIKTPTGLFSGHTTADVPEEVMQAFWEDAEATSPETVSAPPNEFFNCTIDSYVDHVLSPNEFITLKSPGTSNNYEAAPTVRFIGVGESLKIIRENKKSIFNLTPRNREQFLAMDLLLDPKIKLVTLVGKAGCGKTLCSIAAGLNQVLEKKKYKSLIICRPTVPVGNEIGFLPGDKNEKLEPWIAPIKDNLKHLLFSGKKSRHSDITLQNYIEDGIIEVEAITYLRGRSLTDAFIIIDESQNLSIHELKTIITRVGDGSKIVLSGDIEQIDSPYIDSVSNGLTVAVEKFKEYDISGHITLVKGERSELASLASRIL